MDDPETGPDNRLEPALLRCLEDRDAGREPDVLAAAGGDPALGARLGALLAGEHAIEAWRRTAPPDDSAPPETLGGHRILGTLGEGGMGRVFLARDPAIDRLVALKVLKSGATPEAVDRLRFEREVRIAAALDHPNIVPIHTFGKDGGRLWYAMKWLGGPDLGALDRPLAPAAAAAIGAAIARALQAAHEAGVVHRDVKPANVILDDGTPYLVDFGLAHRRQETRLTEAGVVPGTLPYMAPEQLDPRGVVFDPRSDVYALGATLHHALTGRPPFAAATPEALIRAILTEPPPGPALRGRDADLGTLLAWAMEKSPDHRPASALAFAEELDRFARGEPIRVRRAGAPVRLYRAARRQPKTAAALLLALGVAVAGSLVAAAESIEAEARRDADLDAIERALRAKDLVAGRLLAESAVRRYGGDDADVARAARRVRGLEALESLLDAVQDRPEDLRPGEAAALAAAVEKSGGAAHRPRHAALASALVEAASGRIAEALARIDRVEADPALGGAGPATAALRAAFGGAPEAAPPPPPPAGPLEPVFAEIGRRLAGVPAAERSAGVDAALAADPGNVRLLYAKALLVLGERRYAEADAYLAALPASGRVPAAWPFFRALCAAGMEDLGRAGSLLAAVPRRDWTPRMHLLMARLRARGGNPEEGDAEIEAALRAGDPSPAMLLGAGRWWLSRGAPSRARPLLELAAGAGPAEVRDLAAAALLDLEVTELLAREGRSGDPDLQALIADARALAKSASAAEARSGAIALQVRALAAAAAVRPPDPRELLALARMAVNADPGHAPAGEMLALVLEAALREAPAGSIERTALLRESVETAATLVRSWRRSEWLPPPKHAAGIFLRATRRARELGDPASWRKLGCAAMETLPEGSPEREELGISLATPDSR